MVFETQNDPKVTIDLRDAATILTIDIRDSNTCFELLVSEMQTDTTMTNGLRDEDT